ncbi:hypothetical protein DL96DRAFT_18960 [Flagelloscypha sp. PMI_526]|nr:hypothetical protein DL96DRAFT_18960 [Flagelloscypha sp. PMI_526]
MEHQREPMRTDRIPAEIISAIFLVHRNVVLLDDSFAWQPPGDYPAIPFLSPSQTCTHWRSVALGCPSLWSTILLNNVWATKEFVRRSGEATLTIMRRRNHPVPDGAKARNAFTNSLTLVLRESHRIKCIDLSVLREVQYHTDPKPLIDALKAVKWRVIGTMKLALSDPHYGGPAAGPRRIRRLSEWFAPIVRDMLAFPPQSLTELWLYTPCVEQALQDLNVPTLRQLHIRTTLPVTGSIIWSVLERHSLLEAYSIVIGRSLTCPSPIAFPDPISLLHLRELKLEGHRGIVVPLLSKIESQGIKLTLWCSDFVDRRSLHPMNTLANILEIASTFLNSTPPVHTVVCDSSDSTLRLRCTNDSLLTWDVIPEESFLEQFDASDYTHALRNAHFDVCIHEPGADTPAPTLFHPFLSQFQHVKRILVTLHAGRGDGTEKEKAHLWMEFASTLPNLHTLEVSVLGQEDELFSALAIPQGANGNGILPFPSLQSLSIHDACFVPPDTSRYQIMADDELSLGWNQEDTKLLCTILASALETRRDAGIPIQCLRLRRCEGLEQSYIDDTLKQLVHHVTLEDELRDKWPFPRYY